MCWWDSRSAPCVVLLFEMSWNISGILPVSRSEFITAHFTSSRKTLTTESATTMGNCKFNKCWLEFSWVQFALCKRTHNLGTLGVKALVSRTKSEKHQLASKSLQRNHVITHFCTPLSPLPGPSCPVLLDLNSALPLLSHSQVTFKPSSAELQRWSGGAFDFENRVRVCVHNEYEYEYIWCTDTPGLL